MRKCELFLTMKSKKKIKMNKLILCLFLFSLNSFAQVKYVIEDPAWYLPQINSKEADFIELDDSTLLDIRAMGDTAWTYGARPSDGSATPKEASLDKVLDDLDPNKDIFVGDINLLNWESVVGEYCDFIRPTVSFYFLSHPDSILQAIKHGFNLFTLANNHSQDCDQGRAFEKTSQVLHGPLMSAEAMTEIENNNSELIWHGVGNSPWTPKQKIIKIKGKEVKVLFFSLALISWDIPNAAFINFKEPFEDKISQIIDSFQGHDEYLKILSIHTQDASGHMKDEQEAFKLMKRIGELFIRVAKGDIVLGHGAHTYGGVRIFEENNKKSVFITSLGNFIHDGLRSNPDNYIARILVDPVSYKLKQVQMIPFINNSLSKRVEFFPFESDKCLRNNSVLTNFSLLETSNKYSQCTYYSSF